MLCDKLFQNALSETPERLQEIGPLLYPNLSILETTKDWQIFEVPDAFFLFAVTTQAMCNLRENQKMVY
jgi:hypothetical protein